MNIIPRDSSFDLDRIFNHFGVPFSNGEIDSSFFSPKVDITDHEDRFEICAELAGVDKDNVTVSLENGLLTIEAKMETENAEKKKGKVIRKERHSGSFLRSFQVGTGVAEADVSASFKDGLLKLTIPKVEESVPLKKQIEIQ
jgi:HSP20 family protein